MYKCNNCGCKFREPKKVDMETYYGVYSTFGNSYGNMVSVCPVCNDNDIEDYEEDEDCIEREIYNYLLLNHQGKDNLVKNQTLRAKFNISSDKKMRELIANMRKDETYMSVGSVSGSNGGFYICTNEEEKDDSIKNMKRRANQMELTAKIMEWKKGLEE